MTFLFFIHVFFFEAAFATYLEAAQRFGKSTSSTHHTSTKHDEGGGSAHHHAPAQHEDGKMGDFEMEGGGGMSGRGRGSDERELDDEHWMTVHTATEKACIHAKISLGKILSFCSTGSMNIEGQHRYGELVALLTTLQYIQQC